MVHRMSMGEIMLIGTFVFDAHMSTYLFDLKHELISPFIRRSRMFCCGRGGI